MFAVQTRVVELTIFAGKIDVMDVHQHAFWQFRQNLQKNELRIRPLNNKMAAIEKKHIARPERVEYFGADVLNRLVVDLVRYRGNFCSWCRIDADEARVEAIEPGLDTGRARAVETRGSSADNPIGGNA